jgi:hypothetical protein
LFYNDKQSYPPDHLKRLAFIVTTSEVTQLVDCVNFFTLAV